MIIFQRIGDLEGMAMTHFNYSLTYLMIGDLHKALEHFSNSQKIANPLPSPKAKAEMRKTFTNVAQEKGFGEISGKLEKAME